MVDTQKPADMTPQNASRCKSYSHHTLSVTHQTYTCRTLVYVCRPKRSTARTDVLRALTQYRRRSPSSSAEKADRASMVMELVKAGHSETEALRI